MVQYPSKPETEEERLEREKKIKERIAELERKMKKPGSNRKYVPLSLKKPCNKGFSLSDFNSQSQ